jgi:hypothetical protein
MHLSESAQLRDSCLCWGEESGALFSILSHQLVSILRTGPNDAKLRQSRHSGSIYAVSAGAPLGSAPQQPQAGHFPHGIHAPGSPRAGKTGAPFPDSAKSPKNVLDAGSHTYKLAGNEPDAKAILPEPRSVKKQFPISS